MHCSSSVVRGIRNQELLCPYNKRHLSQEAVQLQEWRRGAERAGKALQQHQLLHMAMKSQIWGLLGDFWEVSWADMGCDTTATVPWSDSSCAACPGARAGGGPGSTMMVVFRSCSAGIFPWSPWRTGKVRREGEVVPGCFISTCFAGVGAINDCGIPCRRTSGGKLSVPSAFLCTCR